MQAFIFDLDGVLVDTAKYHYLAWDVIAKQQGLFFDEQLNEQLKGVSRQASLQIILDASGVNYSATEKEKLLQQKNDIYLSYIEQLGEGDVLPGALNLIQSAKQQGIRIALGSASKNARVILQRTALLDYFDCIVDGLGVQQAKPDPEVFLLGAQGLAVDPAQCVVFEDSVAGVEAARRAGMRCVGVGEAALLGQADLVVTSLEEVEPQKIVMR